MLRTTLLATAGHAGAGRVRTPRASSCAGPLTQTTDQPARLALRNTGGFACCATAAQIREAVQLTLEIVAGGAAVALQGQ